MIDYHVPAPPLPPHVPRRSATPRVPEVKKPAAKSFQHAGDLGDIIYAMPTVRALGGGILYLTKQSPNRVKAREEMTAEKAESLGSLLKLQPYLIDVRYAEKYFLGTDYDLNAMRTLMSAKYEHWLALTRCHLRTFSLKDEEDEVRWLQVDYPVKIPDKPVIVARSIRYWNPEFPWTDILKRYDGMMVFVGLPQEHAEFEKKVFKIPYHPTANFLELARVIAGSELFIGNQSAPRAVAEGLKVNVLVEGCGLCPNTNHIRPNATYIYGDEKVHFPLVGDPAKRPRPRIVMSGPVEGLTAYGQLFRELCLGVIRHKIDVSVNPRCVNNHHTPAPEDILALVSGDQKPDLNVTGHNDILLDGCLKGGEIVFTMWESTRLLPKVIENLNRYAKAVIVPSMWNAGTLDAGGCNIPVRIVPLGIDTSIFNYDGPPGSKGVVSFGIAARHAHGKERKGLVSVGRAFQKAFPTETDVMLNYKVHPDCDFERIIDDRITYCAEFLDWPTMARIYRMNTAYVSGSRGEGWGLHLHQAMAVGCCPIAARFGGQSEFFDAGVGRPIKFKQVRATGDYAGMGSWAELDEASLIEQMRWVYKNQKEAKKLGRKAAVRAAEFTWERTVSELIEVLKEFDVI